MCIICSRPGRIACSGPFGGCLFPITARCLCVVFFAGARRHGKRRRPGTQTHPLRATRITHPPHKPHRTAPLWKAHKPPFSQPVSHFTTPLQILNALPLRFPALEADAGRLAQVLHNLVSNACKARAELCVVVLLRCVLCVVRLFEWRRVR